MSMMISDLYAFPPKFLDLSHELVRKLVNANRKLAELKGVVLLLPNQDILLNTLALQEAKDSSAIENVVTSHDELFKTSLNISGSNPAAKKWNVMAGTIVWIPVRLTGTHD